MDPNRARVKAWVDGKEKNLRGLLCSLDKVIWEGANWKPVSMADLVHADRVKKIYHKALLVVHPDKLSDQPQVELARLIFLELNNAWAQFEKDGQKNLFNN